jgi:hypothetical protein
MQNLLEKAHNEIFNIAARLSISCFAGAGVIEPVFPNSIMDAQ